MHQISTASLEYVRVAVSAVASGAAVDPTSGTAQMAFMATEAAPGALDWKTATWETDATTTPDTYYVRCLVGTSGDATLTAGTYVVWVKVANVPETPVLRGGYLRVV